MKVSRKKDRNKKFFGKLMATIILVIGGVVMLLPFLFMVSSSFKKPMDIFASPIKWIPDYWYPDNYKYIFSKDNSIFLIRKD